MLIAPDAPTTQDLLQASAVVSDPEDDEVDLRWEWWIDGVHAGGGGAANELAATRTRKGQHVVARVIPSDPWSQGAPTDSAGVTIRNTPPSITGAAIVPSAPDVANPIECIGLGWTDADNDPPDRRVQWTIDGADGGTQPVLPAGSVPRGSSLACTLTAWDGDDSGPSFEALPVVVGNAPPYILSVDLTHTRIREADTVGVVYAAVDPEGDPVAVSIRWHVDGVLASTAATLNGTSFARGQSVHATVTPHDGQVSGVSASTASIRVDNTPPRVVGMTFGPMHPGTDTVLTATPVSTDVDGDPVHHSYSWLINDERVEHGAPQLDGRTWFDRDDRVQVLVTPHDGSEGGTPWQTGVRTVVNTAPPRASLVISPLPAKPSDHLTCELVDPGVDADGDLVHHELEWTVDGVPFTQTVDTFRSGDTVPASETRNHQTWTCTVTPDDGAEEGPTSSTSVTVSAYGQNALNPGRSCLDILERRAGVAPDGTYWVDPDGDSDPTNSFDVTCDMSHEGGGWTRLHHEDFVAAPDPAWGGTRLYCPGWNSTVLRGEEEMSLTVPLLGVTHSHVRVSMDYAALDSWDGELAFVKLDEVDVASFVHLAAQDGDPHACGNPDYKDRRVPIDVSVGHSGSSVELSVGAILDEPQDNESFGIDEVSVWVR